MVATSHDHGVLQRDAKCGAIQHSPHADMFRVYKSLTPADHIADAEQHRCTVVWVQWQMTTRSSIDEFFLARWWRAVDRQPYVHMPCMQAMQEACEHIDRGAVL